MTEDSIDVSDDHSGKPSEYYDFPREEMVRYVPSACLRLLDVGCGAGGFGRALRRSRPDIDLVGVEPVERAAFIARSAYDNVFIGQFPDAIPLDYEPFDCIMFNDVLEHMVDPWEALECSHRYLRRGGLIICSIPNLRYLPVLYELAVRGNFEYSIEGVLDATHLRFFTRRSMIDMISSRRFAIQRIEGINPCQRGALRLLAVVARRFVEDTRYKQFVIVARSVIPGR